MELILISDSKLKVMLSADDMRNYAFDDMNTIHTKESFRSLMREAKSRCGFNALEGRVFVQLYRSRAGGCELFVTKLEGEKTEVPFLPASSEPSESFGSIRMEKAGKGRGKNKDGEERVSTEYKRYYMDRETSYQSRHVIYRFDEMQHLLSTCGMLRTLCYEGESIAFAEKDRRAYYLALEKETVVAGEHCGRLCPSSLYYYINEHCDIFCSDAVPVLGKLA